MPERLDPPAAIRVVGGQPRPRQHAERFSGLLHGAALLYNLMLSELAAAQAGEASAWQARAVAYRGRLAAGRQTAPALPIGEWRLDDLWERCEATSHRVQPRTRRFVAEWLERATTLGVSVADDACAASSSSGSGRSRGYPVAAVPPGDTRQLQDIAAPGRWSSGPPGQTSASSRRRWRTRSHRRRMSRRPIGRTTRPPSSWRSKHGRGVAGGSGRTRLCQKLKFSGRES